MSKFGVEKGSVDSTCHSLTVAVQIVTYVIPVLRVVF